MAFTPATLTLLVHSNGYNLYRYDTMDSHATVDAEGYFNNTDDMQNLKVGDLIDVVVWATAIRTGTISTFGRHIVNAVTAATGVVDIADVTAGTVTDSR